MVRPASRTASGVKPQQATRRHKTTSDACTLTGDGIPRDDVEAVQWFRLVAGHGHISAQFNLGVMYAEGRGVAHDDVEAVNWFRVAADQGSAAAQARLGLFYLAGTGGVAWDLVIAHVSYLLDSGSPNLLRSGFAADTRGPSACSGLRRPGDRVASKDRLKGA